MLVLLWFWHYPLIFFNCHLGTSASKFLIIPCNLASKLRCYRLAPLPIRSWALSISHAFYPTESTLRLQYLMNLV